MTENNTPPTVGSRIVVTGMAGAGKSTFAKALAAQTGLPLIHLDLHSWKPGWVRVPADEFLQKQLVLLAAKRWIVDSNDVAIELIVNRADTLVVMDSPWWLCAWRAFRRGVQRPADTQLPTGCEESARQRIADEWGIVWRNWRHRHRIRDAELATAAQCQPLMPVHIFRSTQEAANFLEKLAQQQANASRPTAS